MAGNSAEVILLAASPPHHSLFPSGEGVTDLLREFLRWNEYVCFRPFWASLVWFGFVSFLFFGTACSKDERIPVCPLGQNIVFTLPLQKSWQFCITTCY